MPEFNHDAKRGHNLYALTRPYVNNQQHKCTKQPTTERAQGKAMIRNEPVEAGNQGMSLWAVCGAYDPDPKVWGEDDHQP